MDVRLPDGTVIKGVPEGMSQADLTAKLARNGYDVSKLAAPATGSAYLPSASREPVEADPGPDGRYAPGTTRRTTQADIDNAARLRNEGAVQPNNDNMLGRLVGSVEPFMTVGSGLVGQIAGNLAGVGRSITGGKFGTQEGVRQGKQVADQVAGAMTYQPRTDSGKAGLQGIGQLVAPLEGLQGIAGAQGLQMARTAGANANVLRNIAGTNAAAMAAQDAGLVAGAPKLSVNSLANLVREPKPAMAGVGAAATAEEALRAQRFANMRAPMTPTKGILSRSIDDVQFEREAAKRPEGKALDARYANLNEGMGRHMDALIEETGSTAVSRRATGKSVTAAIEAKKAAKKAEVDTAYKAARESGDMAEQIDVQPILDFVGKNRSAARNAGILHSIEDEANRLAGNTGKISLNDMEELRKMVNNLSEPGKPNGHYGGQAIKLIDKISEGKGGPQYQQARRLNENMMKEFSDRDVIDKMLRTKRGTSDRAVAYEDVAKHIISNGSLDDMKHAFRVLEAHPAGTAPEIVAAGQQAARDLRGAAMADIKKRLFSNAGANSAGKTVGSEAKMKAIISELDDEGKLEYLYGKKGAQEIRDTLDVATDIYTTPAGTVNSSNTASALERVLSRAEGMVGGTPVIGHALRYGAKKLESRAMTKRVNNALNPQKPSSNRLQDAADNN